MKKFFDEVDVGQDHAPATVPLELERVHGIAGRVRNDCDARIKLRTNPSLIFSASIFKYSFHLSPMTLPQEKHRTGII